MTNRALPALSALLGALATSALVACGSSDAAGGGSSATDPGATDPTEEAARPENGANGSSGSSGASSSGSTGSSGDPSTGGSTKSDGGGDASQTTDAGGTDASAGGDAGTSADAGNADAGGTVPNDDPFDPASCGGTVLSIAQAFAMLGGPGGAARMKLADATLMRRTRKCTGATAETCGPWGAPVPHTQALLTYSGGVTTDYKTFSFPTHLVLFPNNGTPNMTVRHTSDYQHDATADKRGIRFVLGTNPMVNTYPIINVWDFAPAPYRYEDLAGLIGSRAELDAREHCARFVSTSGVSTEIAALYRY